MIHKCLKLFNLLPTSQSYRWLIAADWLEEENKYTEANVFRENLFHLEIVNANLSSIFGNGFGDGNGYGNGNGNGFGDGYGYGISSGKGMGYGYSYGNGNGWGEGFG